LIHILGADVTYIMLYDAVQDHLKLQSTTDSVLWEEDKQKVVEKYGVESLRQSSTLWYNEMQGIALHIVCDFIKGDHFEQ
jgi:hypothetical protein